MDIASLSMALSQERVMTNVGTSLLKLTMNNTEESINALSKIMDNDSFDPYLGNNIDSTV